MKIRLSGYRRTFAVGAVWVAALVSIGGVTAPDAQAQADSAGTGSAFAQGYKIDPRSGRLSFGITYGLTLAGHQNNSAVAESRSLDLGLIGSTLSAAGCDGGDPTLPKEEQPIPLSARTDDADVDAKDEPELGVDRTVEVSESPFAKATSITTAFGEPNVVTIGGTSSTSTSGLENGARVARAITEVSSIDIGGVLQIRGLRWEAAYQSAPTTAVLTSFTVEGIFLAGENITGPQDNPFAGIQQITDLLRPLGLGIEIVPPTVREESGIAFVDALKIAIVPGDTRDGISGALLSAAQPLREALADSLIEADCSNAGYITVADIGVGSVTGAGELNLEFGGVTATSAAIDATSFLGGIPPFTPATPATSPGFTPAPSSGRSTTPSPAFTSPATSGSPETATPATPDTQTAAATPEPTPISGKRGGALMGVGLGGLFLLGLLAEGDRRKMRRGQRSRAMEVKA